MFVSISNYFHKKAKIRNIFIFLFLLILFFVSLPFLDNLFPKEVNLKSLDELAFNTPPQIYLILDSWGESKRNYEFWFHLIWDFPVPIISSIFLGLLTSWLLQRSFKPKSVYQRFNLIALITIFDILENICIMTMLFFYPESLFTFAWLKIIFTIIKYSLGIPLLLILIICLGKSIINKFHKQV